MNVREIAIERTGQLFLRHWHLKVVVRTPLCALILLPNSADTGVTHVVAHAFLPRLPDRWRNVSTLVEEVFLGAEVKVIVQKILVLLRDDLLVCSINEPVQIPIHLVVSVVKGPKQLLK